MLRDRFVCGLINGSIHQQLLAEQALTLKMVIDLGKTLESAEVETKLMNMEIKAENAFAIEQKSRRCYRCNSDGHLANTCPFKKYVCNTCKMKGHLSKACRKGGKTGFSRARMVTPRNRSHPKNHNLEEIDNITSDDENSVYYVHKIHHVNPLKVEMNMNNKNINFEADTGSGITLISETTYQEKLSNYKFTNTKIAIKTYANESLNVLGKLSVTVQFKENMFTNFPLYVIVGDGMNLLGCNWLSEVKLDWAILFNCCKEKLNISKTDAISGKLETLIKNYSEIFSSELGTIKGVKAKINVKANSQLKFMKARGVPFAMNETVEAEIDRMEKDSILKSVPYSEWANPIVIVPKPDGTIRICADYKRTVNQVIHDTYPPTPEELFSKIQGGERFYKIDLTKTYLQVELDDISQKYLMINKSKGLKQPTRMPYGVKPATGIFQRFIKNVLADIPYTAVKLDDILVAKLMQII